MNSRTEERIVLISVHGDPAIEVGKEEAGGQNVYVRHVGEALAKLGWKVDMFTRKVNAQQDDIVEHTENCRTIRLKAGPTDFVPRDDIFDYLPEFVDNLLKFQQENDFTYPLIHTNYWLSAWVGMQLKQIQGSQQIHTYHSLGAVKYNTVNKVPLIANTRLEVEKNVLETAERIVATSPQEEEHMRSWVSSEGQIDIIPCGTDIERFGGVDKAAARAKLRSKAQTVGNELKFSLDEEIVMYVGRFDRRKGIETLVRAIRKSNLFNSPNLKLIIAGGSRPGQSDGRERERIENIVDELGMRQVTCFPGRLSQEDLPLYYAAADVCVVPSHYEPFGLVAIEAMASGTPVVASDVGGLQFTVVPEETGLLAPPKDVEAFCSAIDRIISDSQWRDKLGQAGRKRVETKFSWNGVAHQLSDLYTEISNITPADAPSLIEK
ncbi:glycosyltransferase family 4 protein [Mastigocoleus testarum]|uniref:Glycoside hydrolase n=1 Tax=Mastigocoleus testarum BC008 TaxID=371196 RepID=A0A0V7ZTI1_9CYAN|nr:glycosyltransferase family 1 protein [Mastigocoleus testarum]KST67965.1 glycoside hydrolase [Mastigocoleus testarum BC008]KST68410.1 glycoside hydrolase [Mastigocoleus testarum BC008]